MNEAFIADLTKKAKAAHKTIAFPEADCPEILECASKLLADDIANVVLVGNQAEIEQLAKEHGVALDGAQYFDNADEAARQSLVKPVLATGDDLSEKAILRKGKKAVNAAMLLVRAGKADCVAAGRVLTTADVIIAAQGIIGLAEGIQVVSSLGIVDAPGFEGPKGSMLAIADCAINEAPGAEELADIAIASSDTISSLLGWNPKVALLAFSTCGSSEGDTIDVIRQGLEIAKTRRPDLKIDGEFQLDAAINPKVAARKVKRESDVAGDANILIFPNLHAGNIGVKLIQTFGHADVYGPVLQGFAKPICDFSRSAPVSEMMGNILMLLVRAK